MKKNIIKKITASLMAISMLGSIFMFSGCASSIINRKPITYADEMVKAIEYDDLDRLEELLSDKEQATTALAEGCSGRYWPVNGGVFYETPLGYATYRGNVEAVKMLVDNGADINQKMSYNHTALFAAMESSSLHKFEIANYLVDNGADIHVCVEDATTFEKSIVWALLSNNGFTTESETLMQEGYAFFVRCVGMGAKLDNTGYYGHLLLDACEYGNNLPMIEYMVETLDCDVNMQINGWTPLMVAAYGWGHYDEVEVVKYLLEQGADTTITNENGETAYDLAVRMDNVEIMAILKPTTENNNGATTA